MAAVCRLSSATNAARAFILRRLLFSYMKTSPSPHRKTPPPFSFPRPFCTTNNPTSPKRSTLVNYSLPDSSDEEEDGKEEGKQMDKSTLPPPSYDPFNKRPAIEQPEDPKNLQEVFHRIRSGGLFNEAVKMCDGLTKEGLSHEALELVGEIKNKGKMPEVVAHTAVMEAYVNAGQSKEAHKVYLRMLASGVLPNLYSYGVLVKGLAASGDEKMALEAKKCVEEMVVKRGMRPGAAVCAAVYEGLVAVGKVDEGRELLEVVKRKGVVPEESRVREALKGKRGEVYRGIMNVFYSK